MRSTFDDPFDGELLAEAEEVRLFDFDLVVVDAAAAVEAQSRLERPGVAGPDLDVHQAVAVGDRLDAGGGEEALGAQRTRGLGEGAGRVEVALGEQQLPAHDARAGFDVQGVGPAEDQLALAGQVGIEDVAGFDGDLAEAGAHGHELCGRRKGRGGAGCSHRSPCRHRL